MNTDDLLTKMGLYGPCFESISAHEAAKSRIKELLQKEIYGILPTKPDHFCFTLTNQDPLFAAGKARLQNLNATLYLGNRAFEFPFRAVIPNKTGALPAFIYIDSEKEIPNKFLPSEEIADCGFAVFSFHYESFTKDIPKFNDSISSFLGINRHCASAAGKLMLWAFAAMRIMDYVEALDFIDKERVAVIGHSRLAEAALLAAAFDERFKYTVLSCPRTSIISGCTDGDFFDMANLYPHWYAPRYPRYASSSQKSGYSKNALLSLIPPRRLVIGAAENDLSADHENELAGLCSLSKSYELYGLSGLIHKNKMPKSPFCLDGGNICYHKRGGAEYLSRDDWRVYTDYIKKDV